MVFTRPDLPSSKIQNGNISACGKNWRLCFEATLETRHNKDSRKHNGQKQHPGQVTAIVLVCEKETCRLDECTAKSRLFTHVLPKFTTQSQTSPVFSGKNNFFKSEYQKRIEELTMGRSS